MKHQVRANLIFTDEDEARDFYRDCELALAKTGLINPETENLEFSTIELISNNHDQEPNQPCKLLRSATTKPEH